MKGLAVGILVFCTFLSAGLSFKCYKCSPEGDEDYSVDQCEEDQTEVECPPVNVTLDFTCSKYHGTTTSGKEIETRGCTLKSACNTFKKICEEGTEEQKKVLKIKECEAACCVSDGDKPCNGGFTVSINMFIITLAVLCSLKLF